jgi:hypothetical protein
LERDNDEKMKLESECVWWERLLEEERERHEQTISLEQGKRRKELEKERDRKEQAFISLEHQALCELMQQKEIEPMQLEKQTLQAYLQQQQQQQSSLITAPAAQSQTLIVTSDLGFLDGSNAFSKSPTANSQTIKVSKSSPSRPGLLSRLIRHLSPHGSKKLTPRTTVTTGGTATPTLEKGQHERGPPARRDQMVNTHSNLMRLTLDLDYRVAGEIKASRAIFERDLITDVAKATNEPVSTFLIKTISAGSIVIDIEVLGKYPLAVIAILRKQAVDPVSPLRSGKLTRALKSIDATIEPPIMLHATASPRPTSIGNGIDRNSADKSERMSNIENVSSLSWKQEEQEWKQREETIRLVQEAKAKVSAATRRQWLSDISDPMSVPRQPILLTRGPQGNVGIRVLFDNSVRVCL